MADLFDRLARAEDAETAKGIAGLIQRVLLRSNSPTADLLMTRARAAVQKKDHALAESILDKIVISSPEWVEGWNQRATVRFLREDYAGSMADIAQVLAIEPRHFGALAGMGFILQRTGNDARALEVFRRALAIYPQFEDVKKAADSLKIEVEGRDI